MKTNSFVAILFAVILFNLYFFPYALGFSIYKGTQILSLMCICIIIFDCLVKNGQEMFNAVFSSVKPIFIYFVYILISGTVIYLFNGYNVTETFAFFEKFIFAVIVVYIVKSDRSAEKIYIIGILLAVTVGIYALLHFGSSNLYTRLALSESVSENVTGLIFTFGVICTFLSTQSIFANRYVKLGLYFLFGVVLVLTASRQALIILLLILFAEWVCSRDKKTGVDIKKIIFIVFLGICVVWIANSDLIDLFTQTKLYARITGNSTSTSISDGTRIDLYRFGIQTFFENPIIGCGFNNLRIYTHSTYMEVLGGTGLIGFILFFFPIFRGFVSTIKAKNNDDIQADKIVAKKYVCVYIAMFIMMLFRATHYYIISIIIISLMFSQPYLFAEIQPQSKSKIRFVWRKK